jgi:hypothetical protein
MAFEETPRTPKTPAEYAEMMKDQTKINSADFVEAFERVGSVAREVNNTFGQSRERINEVKVALTDALPNVVRLGGDLGAVGDTISQIAEASRRNVVANTEDVQKLYASTKVIGGSVQEIADAFLNVGVGIEQVGKQLEDSVNYVRSIGGNTKQVMGDVRANMEQMNRYQFEGGVQGLTKMAAQASMLRFDMGETFRLADKVLSPEGAIEVAAAFQRLGVSAGALADPFQLMNQSINDPSGLQNSLADVAKQFTYFDEKTKTFKINPQGVLTLREMQEQTGVSAKEMSKMGLAAAELDQRLSSINAAGLKLGSEEDKQYLANIAKMGEGGQYEVKLTNEKGELETRKLSELTQGEFDKLIKEQKEGPKTMEEIAKSQMTISADIAGNVSAIKSAVLGGAVTQKDVLTGSEAIRKLSSAFTGALSKNFSSPQKVRDGMTNSFDDAKELFKDIANKDVKTTDALSNYLTKFGTQLSDFSKDAQSAMIKTLQETRGQLTDKNAINTNAKAFIDQMLGENKNQTTKNTGNGNRPISSLIEGTNASSKVKSVVGSNNGGFRGGSSDVKVGGSFTITVDFKGGAENLSSSQKEEITKMLVEKWNSTETKEYIVEVSTPNNPLKPNYGARVGN